MFEIAGAHIAQLSDTDLRTLVARLCEAELRRVSLPVSVITAGGDQDAPDGGIDVRVDLPQTASPGGFILRPQTGFQVKKPIMQGKKITAEMRPKDMLRPAIKELASVSGAYIIVSGKADVTDDRLTELRTTMREALADLDDAERLTVDYYDRDRLARCVRNHHGLIAWVREKIGQPIQGWQSFGDWSKSRVVNSTYLIDETARLHDLRNHREGGLSVEQGIQRIREILSRPRGVVRLVGLSGTGKTRFLEALFDERVGQDALDPALAHYSAYADEAESPTPTPGQLMRRLIQEERRAIVIIDNCLPATHRALAAICTEAASRLSLITVEFDVGEDEPEHTDGLFLLESASPEVIEKLIESRYPEVSQANRYRIAELSISGGNARMALALARTVEHGENLAKLTDKSLFERLFHQRQKPDKALLRAAQVCSLVYSFEGEAMEGDGAELPVLAGLARMSADELYAHVAELYRRGLVQRRGQWRAVLPQALALWLASRALEDFPLERIESAMLNGPRRLLLSFSRRLGYLHDSEMTQKVVRGWLSEGGILAAPSRFNQHQIDMFWNIAPVMPDLILNILERAVRKDEIGLSDRYGVGHDTWISLLSALAYEPAFFNRAALLLVEFADTETKNNNMNSAGNQFKSFFKLYLSGTHATIEQRLDVLENLLSSESPSHQELALEAMDRLLEVLHFSGHSDFRFGAHPRDYGWHPNSWSEVQAWYRNVIAFVLKVAVSDSPHAPRARHILANRFYGLWIKAEIFDELEATCQVLAEREFWPDGWIAVRNAIRLCDEKEPPHLPRLRLLEKTLRPADMVQTAEAYIFSERWGNLDISDGDDEQDQGGAIASHEKAEMMTENLGKEIANQPVAFEKLLPRLMRRTAHRGWSFGRGLAVGTPDLSCTWAALVNSLATMPTEERDVSVLRGFLSGCAERDPVIGGVFLDTAVEDSILGPWFPLLQTAVEIGERGAERLEASLRLERAPIWTYRNLAFGRATDSIPSKALRQLVIHISTRPEGFEVAMEIFDMRLWSLKSSGATADSELVQCGRELLLHCDFSRYADRSNDELSEIVNTCLVGVDAVEAAAIVCRRLASALADFRIYLPACSALLQSLFVVQTTIALDELMGNRPESLRLSFIDDEPDRRNPLKSVSTEMLLNWANNDAENRFPSLAAVIPLFAKDDSIPGLTCSEIAMRLLDLAPDRHAVLKNYQKRFWPSGCIGSRADLLDKFRILPRALLSYPDNEVVAWAREQDVELAEGAERERARERKTDERFE